MDIICARRPKNKRESGLCVKILTFRVFALQKGLFSGIFTKNPEKRLPDPAG